jgi:hypothetical protein
LNLIDQERIFFCHQALQQRAGSGVDGLPFFFEITIQIILGSYS